MRRPFPAGLVAAALSAAVSAGLLAGPALPASAVTLGPLERVPRLLQQHQSAGPVPTIPPLPGLSPTPQASPSAQPSAGSPRSAEQAAAELGRRVQSALAGSTAVTVAGAVDVDGLGAVLRREADHALPPASTQKPFAALSALLTLGPDARYATQVVSAVTPVAGQLAGSVYLVASGDPYLTKGGLGALAADVRDSGVTSISGDVLLDDTRYDSRRTADGWKSAYLPGQSGPLSALAVDGNTYRRDDAFLRDPALPNAALFRDALVAAGVSVAGTVRRGTRPAEGTVLATRVSGPMSAVVRRILKESDNFGAELLLKEVGASVRSDGSSAGGLAAVRQVLAPLDVPVGPGSDGSGLSANDRQTPAGEVRLLQAAQRSAVGPALRASLPLGCRDGTLRRRFCGTAAEGKVSAKTGTLSGVRALAGFTRTASGRDVWFAFQLTGVQDGGKALAAIDRAVVTLAAATE